MNIRIPREFRLQSVPATISLSNDDILQMADPFPAEVILSPEYAEVYFESPRAAVDFVESLKGHVPFSAIDMTAEEDLIFNDPEVRAAAQSAVNPDEPRFVTHDRSARRWGITAFTVAAAGLPFAIAALVISIVALVS